MSDRPELYIHIGMQKTGTSAVQDILNNHRNWFADQGLFYPSVGIRFNAHHLLGRLLIETSDKHVPEPDFGIETLLAEIDEQLSRGINRFLISSEGLATATAIKPSVRDLMERFDVRVVVLVREPIRWLNSLANQILKSSWFNGMSATQDSIAKRFISHGLHMDRKITTWAEVVGWDNVVPCFLDLRDDFEESFWNVVGLRPPPDVATNTSNRSARLDTLSYIIAHREWAAGLPHPQRVRIMQQVNAYNDATQDVVPNLLLDAYREEMFAVSDKVIETFRNRFGADAVPFETYRSIGPGHALSPLDLERVLEVDRYVLDRLSVPPKTSNVVPPPKNKPDRWYRRLKGAVKARK